MCVVITGAGGLVGSEASKFFLDKGYDVIGIDNDMRRYFFGVEGSTNWRIQELIEYNSRFHYLQLDIRDTAALETLFSDFGKDIELVIHTAAQPSHDWAAKEPFTDFSVNAVGTLNLLENVRCFSPDAVFIFTSTNKVYGDTPNRLPLLEQATRWEIDSSHQYAEGIDESMSIDQCKHSLFGASKAAADILVQEYGRYFSMKTACFRAGCITGPAHSATQLHGFLNYLMKCVACQNTYNIFGYKGKQVRDNIHSFDLVNAFYHFFKAPRSGEVYNIGGSRFSNCSMIEAIEKCEQIAGIKFEYEYVDQNRIGDHIWWISNVDKFKSHYPGWELTYNVDRILEEMYRDNVKNWSQDTSNANK